MNFLFSAFTALSIASIIFFAPNSLLAAVTISGEKALTLSLKLVSVYAFWLGILSILENTPLVSKINKILRPAVSRLFKGESEQTQSYISLNIASNMLGVGNAATPLAILAMKNMKRGDFATKNMVVLFMLNATSLQIFPTTIISLRASFGSANPSLVLIPSIITSTIVTVVGVTLVLLIPARKYLGKGGDDV